VRRCTCHTHRAFYNVCTGHLIKVTKHDGEEIWGTLDGFELSEPVDYVYLNRGSHPHHHREITIVVDGQTISDEDILNAEPYF
jgi:hypothetical protein